MLQREAEILEADADGSTPAQDDAVDAATSRLLPAKTGDNLNMSPRPPAAPSAADLAMAGLQQEISKLSVEDKVARLEEVYEDLDVLVGLACSLHCRCDWRRLLLEALRVVRATCCSFFPFPLHVRYVSKKGVDMTRLLSARNL